MKDRHIIISGFLGGGCFSSFICGEITAASVFLVGAALAYLIGDKNEH